MKRWLGTLVLLLAWAGPAWAVDFDLGFSPGKTSLAVVQKAIASAQTTILVAAYEFTSPEVAQALASAAARGVKVWAVVDLKAAQSHSSQAAWLAAHGVAVRRNGHYAIFHHKFLVIDRDTVETGSFNYTKAAVDHNAENALVIHGVPDLAAAYAAEWKRLWDEAADDTLSP